MNYDYDAIIVGASPAGSTTALYAARLDLHVLKKMGIPLREVHRRSVGSAALGGRFRDARPQPGIRVRTPLP